MKILNFISPFVFLFLFIASCSEAGTVEYVGDSNEEDSTVLDRDSLEEDLGDSSNFLDVYAFLDGPDEWFYMVASNDFNGEEEVDLYGVEELHIIPMGCNEPDLIQDFMVGISDVKFKLNDPYDNYTGLVKVYYNCSKSTLACEYQVVNGEPDGTCTLLDPDGNVFIEREYSEGEFKNSNKEPFAAMWTLNQPNSSLIIDDKRHAFSAEGANQVVSIMPSNYPDPDYKNTLYQVMKKETFKNQFRINGDIFTGILRAYFHPNSMDPQMYYELPFKNGWLHGDVIINDDWGDLYLHEIFVDGELDSTVFQMEYGDGVAKPILYLYPEEDMIVDVELDFDGELTHTYPKYNQGWRVLAKPDGTLYDETGKEYYALYWEGDNRREFTMDEGFVIPGDKSAEFLEKSLDALGLNRREANEFIVYWLPKLEQSPYNLIHFSTSEYEEMAKLDISPQPETIIRVMMVYKSLDAPIEIPLQDLSNLKVDRKGFTIVEWGGTEYKRPLIQ